MTWRIGWPDDRASFCVEGRREERLCLPEDLVVAVETLVDEDMAAEEEPTTLTEAAIVGITDYLRSRGRLPRGWV